MSLLDEIKQLESQKQKLVTKAKAEALKTAEKAVAELNAMGFDFRLVEGATSKPATAKRKYTKRRAGIREQVFNVVSKSATGVTRAEIIASMGATDQSGKQSISNALSALKKAKRVYNKGRKYTAA